ncbi:Na+/H+ antiporter NhaC family protein [Fusobacterium sp.]|uniref:Na+/H+ antiporter NhaC family protein n=1 Tax=Fusobacterium sp. TaxID=68766 RepID=UPI002624B8D8|nr:Na+/H+ antiporter NhaC family protein [Fusobacterium sp.]
MFYRNFWSLVPSLGAILLSLITKEVYSSLFLGVALGGLFYSNFNIEKAIVFIVDNGFMKVLSDKSNIGVLIFLVILGTMVCLMNKAGGSLAFGEWAGKKIKSRVSAQLATILLGCLIFIDGYFNCLTVGSVMRPVTDKYKISRAKLAYIIDSTAAPICVIAPISSWAAAVTGFVPGKDGFTLFVNAIPYNFYAFLTLIMLILSVALKVDLGSMKIHENNALNGDLFTTEDRSFLIDTDQEDKKGSVLDLIIPIALLISCCIIGMIYTGGFFEGASFKEAFARSDASLGLSTGSIVAMLITMAVYPLRKVLSFRQCINCISEGYKSMVPAIMIFILACTLKSMIDSLGATSYVADLMRTSAGSFSNLLPAIIFLVGCGLAFATGTSWGTFGILIPIVVSVFSDDPQMMIISISACLSGAVCGDHCSPISDTTIMSSAGAQSNHINHVYTQLPYALIVAGISFISYIILGYTKNLVLSFGFGIVSIVVILAYKKVKEYKFYSKNYTLAFNKK